MINEKEEWKDIVDYVGYYQVSSHGRIKSLKRTIKHGGHTKEIQERILKISPDKGGYLTFGACKDGIQRTLSVHRMVAQAFLPNPDNLATVNHIDEDKANNMLENLEWMSQQQNNEYSKSKHYKFFDPSDKPVDIFNLAEFCRNNGLNQGAMCQVALGTLNHHKGWKKHRVTL